MVIWGVRIGRLQLHNPRLSSLNPKPPPPYSKPMIGLPTQSGSGEDEEERQAVRQQQRQAVRSSAATMWEERWVTTEVVLD